MRRFLRFFGFLTAALTLAGCAQEPAAPVKVEDVRVTLPAVKGRPGAGYFRLEAAGAPIRLTGIKGERIGRIELHESMMHGGAMRMAPLKEVAAPANGSLDFAPGGKHAMLFGIDPALKPGDHIPLTFTFDGIPPLTAEAEVLGPGGTQ